jgi:HTH-type transcriptional regulator, global nitrogen regulator NrpRI
MLQESGSLSTERKVMAILRVLSESSEPLGSITIARELERYGVFLSERAIRYHLRLTDERGYTQPLGRDGRLLTSHGLEELKIALAPQQVGFILQKLELLAFYTTFDPVKKTGQLPINTTLIDKNCYKKGLELMSGAFQAGICVSNLVVTAREGERLGNLVVPPGKVGLGTVCSAVINGVLLKSGVPIESKFGGVLEIRDGKPRRFVAVINYAGTSLDPSEQYIRGGMTSVSSVVQSGSGKLLANFREIPSPCRKITAEKIGQLREAGIGGVYALGNTSEPVCQIAVGLNRVGMVLLGGLSPVAMVVEAGLEAENVAESGLVDFTCLKPFQQAMDEA